ncbi:lactate racemase domain-containing protein [Desulfomarina sp.]
MKDTGRSREIAFGKDILPVTVPANSIELNISDPSPAMNRTLFTGNLSSFLKTHPLDLSRPVIIVTDKTRLCDYPVYLPPLIAVLEQYGMHPKNLRFIIAYGTHPVQSDGESRQLYGNTFDRFPFIHHNCDDRKLFADLGTTSRGTPIRFRKDILEASCVITMGPIVHHYFAGYGGGRKLLFPGCGERKAIYKNHSLYLEETGLATGCQPGRLKNNPLAEDLAEIASRKPADMAIHGILDSNGHVCNLLIGNSVQEYFNGCAVHGQHCEIESELFDLVIASCGGFPKDINFIQSHKAIHNSAMFVKDGGLLIIYSECRDGIGSGTFLPWFRMGNFEKAFEALAENYRGNGGTALAMMTKVKRIRIGMVTSLDAETCRLIGVEKWQHHEVEKLLASTETASAWISNGSLLVKKP